MAVQLVKFLRRLDWKGKLPLDSYRIEYENEVKIGDFFKDVDGFYYFWPKLHGGSWNALVMRIIADKLDELNRPWEEEIAKDIQSSRTR